MATAENAFTCMLFSMTDLLARMAAPGRKKILALDGGGIRAVITIEVLAKIETLVREQLGKPELVLAEYFDFVAGTSTGAIIATCVSLGMKVADIRELFTQHGPAMFDKTVMLNRFRHKLDEHPLREVFGAETTLGSAKLKTLLMMVLRNATNDSPWPLSNHPKAKLNQRNLELPLWQLLRASSAAPSYLPPEVIRLGKKPYMLADGGSTLYNNPAFQAFIMATIEPYGVEWRAAHPDLLVVSVGTGASTSANINLVPGEQNLIYNASSMPAALMHSALVEQDTLCRIFGLCRVGDPIDRELGDLRATRGPNGADKMFTYLRYNVDLSEDGLESLGVDNIPAQLVQPLDAVEHLDELQTVGRALARTIKAEHFEGFT